MTEICCVNSESVERIIILCGRKGIPLQSHRAGAAISTSPIA
jgi:hypothetical protein